MSTRPPGTGSGAQTLHRALDVLETVAAHGRSLALADIASATGLSTPTVHRLCRALVERGYMRQLADRTYALGIRLVPLGNAANALLGVDAEAVLTDLVAEIGETANLAVLAGRRAEYVAQVPSRFSMRMFTEVGRRVDLHSTGVGKALLAQLDDESVLSMLGTGDLSVPTPHTLATRAEVTSELERIRERGYALDEQEQELGVRCVAVPVPHDALAWMALSVSGPSTRMTDDVVQRAVPLLHRAARRLAADLDGSASSE